MGPWTEAGALPSLADCEPFPRTICLGAECWHLLSSSSSLPHVACDDELEQEQGSESSGTHLSSNRW